MLVDRSGGYDNGLEVTLTADHAPRPGETVTLVFEVKALADIPSLDIQWQVPAGATLLGDPADNLGALAPGDTATSTRKVSFPTSGTYKIAVGAGFSPGPDIRYGAAGVLFFTVAERAAAVSDLDPAARSPMGTNVAQGCGIRHLRPKRGRRTDPCFTINGLVQRTERPTNINGYGANTTVPVAFARVEVREEDTLFDDTYDDFTTDAQGRFTSKFCDDDGVFDDELEIYVRLHAEIYVNDHLVAEVEDSTWIEENYEFDTEPFDSEGGTYDIVMDLDMTQSAIFNMADAALDAWLVWRDNGGAAGGDSIFDEEAEIQWEPGEGQDGSKYVCLLGRNLDCRRPIQRR